MIVVHYELEKVEYPTVLAVPPKARFLTVGLHGSRILVWFLLPQEPTPDIVLENRRFWFTLTGASFVLHQQDRPHYRGTLFLRGSGTAVHVFELRRAGDEEQEEEVMQQQQLEM